MARLIRGPGSSAIVPRAIIEAEARAARIVAEAEATAQASAAAARLEAERIRSEAEAEGKSHGYAIVAALALAARGERDRALASAERELVTLATAIARRLVRDTIASDPSIVATFAAEAIERARGASTLRLRVAPEDASALADLVASNRLPLTLAHDASLSRGDCVVEGDIGTIDARLETKLCALHDALLRELGRGKA